MRTRKTTHIAFRGQLVLLVSVIVFALLFAAVLKNCAPDTHHSGDKRKMDIRR